MAIRTDEQQAGILATLRRFPGMRDGIETLMVESEDFRDMCGELAVVEATLTRIDQLPLAVRESRRKECDGWIERLTKEIAEALRNSNVIKLEQPRKSINANPRHNQR